MADKMQIDRVLVLSTSHLQQLTDIALTEEALHDLRGHGVRDGKEHDGMPATMLWPCGDGFHGYLIWVDIGFVTMSLSDKHPDLVAVIDFARQHECQWIRFDCDGPVIDELPTFDWNEKVGHRDAQGVDDETAMQESPEKKAAWLSSVRRQLPIGTRVEVIASDVNEYVGARGEVVEYDIGTDGDWPLVCVKFDAPVAYEGHVSERDAFYFDGPRDLGNEIKAITEVS